MENLINKIHNCKNQEILKDIPDKSIQLFLEDMPFNNTEYDYEYKVDLKEYWSLRLSKIKDNGCFVLKANDKFYLDLRLSNLENYKYTLIWNKFLSGSFVNAKVKPLIIHEYLLVFSLSSCANNSNNNMLYFPQMTETPKEKLREKNKKSTLSKGIKVSRKENSFSRSSEDWDKFKRFPVSILNFNNRKAECNNPNRIHPQQVPISLFEYLIKTYTNEDDLVFDGFSGSGTTAIACDNLKRNFICCETDKGYFDKSVQRLKENKLRIF